MKTINITCDTCHLTIEVVRTSGIPDNVISMGCNWCPKCEDKADDYYREWYNESENNETKPDPIPGNQLCMPFEIDKILNSDSVMLKKVIV